VDDGEYGGPSVSGCVVLGAFGTIVLVILWALNQWAQWYVGG
jgi:hypothetical protein